MADLPCHDASTLLTSSNDEDILGHGSYGMVRRCQSEELGEVAVKCFSVEGNEKTCRKVNENVERELAVLRRLGHNNIVKLLAKTEWNNCIGIIMEYVSGGSLENLLQDEFGVVEIVPWLLRLRLYYEVALALRYLHHHDNKRAYIHGDLKPQNILLTPELEVKVADFGSVNIATASRQTNRSINISSTSQHTPNYTAPEVLNSPLEKRKTSSDVYSFGIVGYEMITRKVAYAKAPIAIVEARIRSDGLKPDEKIINEVETSLQDCLDDLNVFNILKSEMMKCWDFAPGLRPNSKEVCNKLGKELEATEPPPAYYDEIEDVKAQMQSMMTRYSTSSKVGLNRFYPPFANAAPLPLGLEVVSQSNQEWEEIQYHKEKTTETEQLPDSNERQPKHKVGLTPDSEHFPSDEQPGTSRAKQFDVLSASKYSPSGKQPGTFRANNWETSVKGVMFLASVLSAAYLGNISPATTTSEPQDSTIGERALEHVEQPKLCPDLVLSKGLTASCTNGRNVGSKCDFSCPEGQTLKGSSNIDCLASAEWSSSLPTCECPPCTTGPNCNENLSWEHLKTQINGRPKTKFFTVYAGNSIKCIGGVGRHKLSLVFDCTCMDLSTNHQRKCKKYHSQFGACEHTLAFLVRDMVAKGVYPRPCDEPEMPTKC
ncbi:uncharacterized protein LOC143460240 isoform X3 [Clavelina lepadiformis]|uniref:uncharacterized protein LOC143460240 isoform X3 n=1 Tax=Clavelina lepadiformis TaxID=159417 RepID=UPI004042016C